MLRIWFAVVILGWAGLAAAADEVCDPLPLDGQWELSQQTSAQSPTELDHRRSWQPVEVPSNWYLQFPWLHGKVWYRHRFDLANNDRCRAVLRFDGVDYQASIWINGEAVGSHTGYFAPFEFLVSQHLKSGTNELLVLVDSPLESADAWSLRKTAIKGVLSHHDTRPGGAWSVRGQERNTGGIWNSVYLDRYSDARIGPLQLAASSDLSLREWTLSVDSDIDARPGLQLSRAELLLTPVNHQSRAYRYEWDLGGSQPTVLSAGALALQADVDRPAIWFPAGYGEPALYHVTVNLYAGARLVATAGSEFGFRRVDYSEPDDVFRINNKRFFVRGTNYISTQWLSTMDTAAYQRDIEMMQTAHINAVRVHAHIERPEFYRQADRAGILIWQDFPLQWGYSDSTAFRQEAVRQAGEMVTMLRNHPSVVNWTLQNEPPFDAFWMKWKYPDYNPQQNRQLVAQLYRAVAEADDSRWIQAYSATDTHPWLGWYSGSWKDYAKDSKSRWVTEFGAQALPDISSLKKIFLDRDLWPDTEQKWRIWKYRNFQPRETFEIAQVSMGEDIHEFIRNTQQYQATLTSFAARSLRRQKYSGVNGVFQFMFVENWPSINWGVVDYWRNPKPGYSALAMAYQPVMPMIDWRDVKFDNSSAVEFPIWLLNDYWTAVPDATLSLQLSRLDIDMPVHTSSHRVSLPADSAQMAMRYQPIGLSAGRYELRAQLLAGDGNLLGVDKHVFEISSGALLTELDN